MDDCMGVLKMYKKILKIGNLAVILPILAGCAASHISSSSPDDPYENMNRNIFAFNTEVDKLVIRPVAKGYDFIFPKPIKRGVANFFSNLGEVPTVVNDVLQVEPAYALISTWRLILNSTVGVGGLFDVATPIGLVKNHQDFGLTLAKWGVKNTPYIVLPLIGPSTLRDTAALPFNYAFSATFYIPTERYRYILTGISIVDTRTKLLSTDKMVNEAFDPYVFVRDAYLQRRAYLIDKNTSGNMGEKE